ALARASSALVTFSPRLSIETPAPKSIHGGGDANRVRHLGAGDEAGGSALAKAGAFGERAQGAAFRQRDEYGPQHAAPCSARSDFRGLGRREAIISAYGALQ